MKKVLSFSLGLILIGNFLFAQTNFVSVASGNWSSNATWGTAAGVYPGAVGVPGGTGSVTISTGDAVVLDVSPLNAIASLQLIIGTGAETLTISAGQILNVTGNVLIAGAITGGGANKTIIMNGAGAELNIGGNLTLTPGNADTKSAILQFNGGGLVHVATDANLSTAEPQRTQINFNGGGTLTVDGNITGGQISVVGAAATSTLNIGGSASTVGNLIMNSAG